MDKDEKVVYAVIANNPGSNAYSLVRNTNFSKTKIRKIIDNLVSAGHVKVNRIKRGSRYSNLLEIADVEAVPFMPKIDKFQNKQEKHEWTDARRIQNKYAFGHSSFSSEIGTRVYEPEKILVIGTHRCLGRDENMCAERVDCDHDCSNCPAYHIIETPFVGNLQPKPGAMHLVYDADVCAKRVDCKPGFDCSNCPAYQHTGIRRHYTPKKHEWSHCKGAGYRVDHNGFKYCEGCGAILP